jgi:multidrug efflux pump subunit AcrA (membrane-fusion protein)
MPDSTAKKRAVKIGIRTPDKVQILDGVTPADTVITEGGYGLDDGTKVKVGGKDEGDDSSKGNGDGKGNGDKD